MDTSQLKGAIAGLLGFAVTEEQIMLAVSPADETGSPATWAALPVVTHNTEFKSQQVHRLRAIRTRQIPDDFAEVDHSDPAVYWRYAAVESAQAGADSIRVAGELIAGLVACADEDLVESSRHPWLRGRQLWLQIVVRGFWHPAGHMADYYLAHGQPARAVALAAQALATARYLGAPDEATGMAAYNLACAQAKAGLLADAAAAVRETIALHPGLRNKLSTEPDLAALRDSGSQAPAVTP
jgi:hypothetical protein